MTDRQIKDSRVEIRADIHDEENRGENLKNDFRLIETYEPSNLEQLTIPIAALGANGDTRYDHSQISAWKARTAGAFIERWFEGVQDRGYWGTAHRYVTDNPMDLLRFLSNDLPLVGVEVHGNTGKEHPAQEDGSTSPISSCEII